MLVIEAVLKLIYLIFLFFKFIDIAFKKLFMCKTTKEENDYFIVAKSHIGEVIYAIYYFYKQIFVIFFKILSCILVGLIIMSVFFFFVILKKLIIFLYFYIKDCCIFIYYNLFNSLKFNYLIIELIFMFIILYNDYISNIFREFNYLIKYQYELLISENIQDLKKKLNNQISPDLKIYYPMEYAMKSVMVRLTGIILFIFLFIILIFEFITIYISPNLVFLFFPLFELKHIKIQMIAISNFKSIYSSIPYFDNNSPNLFHLLTRIICLFYFLLKICIVYFCYFSKFFFLLSWDLLNDYIISKIILFNILSKNIIFIFIFMHIYYTFFHTYIFINNFFMDFLSFLKISKQIIIFFYKKLMIYSKIIFEFFSEIFNTKSKPPLIS